MVVLLYTVIIIQLYYYITNNIKGLIIEIMNNIIIKIILFTTQIVTIKYKDII